jgi:hypothetical protein
MRRGGRFALIALAMSIAWTALVVRLASPITRTGGLAFPAEYRFLQHIDLLLMARECAGLPLAFLVIALATLAIELTSQKTPIGGGFNLLKVACVTGISGLALGGLDWGYSRSVRAYAEREIRRQYAAFAARKDWNVGLVNTFERCPVDDPLQTVNLPRTVAECASLEAEDVLTDLRASTAWAPGGWFWLVRPGFHNAVWHNRSFSAP